MYFDAQPIPDVIRFIKDNYTGGTILDYGCGCGRYTQYFPKDKYLGVDGHKDNIKTARKLYPDYKFELHNLEKWKPEKFNNLFSSVVFDQVEKLPHGWADKYILIELGKYGEKAIIKEPLEGSNGTMKMVLEEL
jgi:trans-aconitate methyltransferase